MIDPLSLARKGLAAVVIDEDLVAALGAGAISYPSATHYLREAKFATPNPVVNCSEPIREQMIATRPSCSP
jgi:hypothetical protein